jgi:hypothetical protein
MDDPVFTVDGNTYERNAIAQWFATGNVTSPLTNARLGSRMLTPNLALKRAIQQYIEEQAPALKRVVTEVQDYKLGIALREKDLEAAAEKNLVKRAELDLSHQQLKRANLEIQGLKKIILNLKSRLLRGSTQKSDTNMPPCLEQPATSLPTLIFGTVDAAADPVRALMQQQRATVMQSCA